MAFNSVLVVSVAKASAGIWQRVARLPERIDGEELLELVLCVPLQQFCRWATQLWTYLSAVSPYPPQLAHVSHRYATSYYGSGSDLEYNSEEEEEEELAHHHHHHHQSYDYSSAGTVSFNAYSGTTTQYQCYYYSYNNQNRCNSYEEGNDSSSSHSD